MKFIKRIPLIISIVFASTFLFAGNVFAQSASLYFSPSTLSVGLNQSFSVRVMVNSGGADISGVTADLTYPSDILEVTSINTASSVFSVEAESSYSGGTVNISRASSGGGSYNGDGEVVTVNFRSTSSGTANLAFTNEAVVMTAGASPTDILESSGTAVITASNIPATGFLDEIDLKVTYGIALLLIGLIGYLLLVYINQGIYESKKKIILSQDKLPINKNEKR